MKGVRLVHVVTVLTLFCAFDARKVLLTGDGFIDRYDWLKSEEDVKDYYAEVFRKYNDTVIWYDITVTCPSEFFCAQFFYIRKMKNEIRVLEYTDFQCTESTVLRHYAMVIMNDRDESNVAYTPEYSIHHNCNSTSYSSYGGKFRNVSTKITMDDALTVTLPEYMDGNDSDSNRTIPRGHFTSYMNSLTKYYRVTPENKLEYQKYFYSPVVFSVLRSIVYPISVVQSVPQKSENFERCRASVVVFPDRISYPDIACSRQVYGKHTQPKRLHYAEETIWKLHTLS